MNKIKPKPNTCKHSAYICEEAKINILDIFSQLTNGPFAHPVTACASDSIWLCLTLRAL